MPLPPPAGMDRNRVLELAGQAFAKLGLGATLEDVAKASSLAKADLQRVCISKEDLLCQVLGRELDLLVERSDRMLDTMAPFALTFERLTHQTMLATEQRPFLPWLMLGRLDDLFPAWRARFDELRARCLGVPVHAVELGIRMGAFRSDLPVELVAQILFELHVTGHLMRLAHGPDAAQRSDARRKVALALLFDGLEKRGGAQPPPGPIRPSAPTKRAAEPAEKDVRTRLLDAVEDAAAKKPLGELKIREIASAAHASPQEASSVFPDWQAMILLAIERDADEARAAAEPLLQSKAPAIELLRNVSEAAFERLKGRPMVVHLFKGSALEALPDQGQKLSEITARLVAVPLKALERGVAEGAFRDDLPLPVVAQLLFELHMAGYLLHYRPSPDLRARALQRRTASIEILFHGLGRR